MAFLIFLFLQPTGSELVRLHAFFPHLFETRRLGFRCMLPQPYHPNCSQTVQCSQVTFQVHVELLKTLSLSLALARVEHPHCSVYCLS